jgi:hypothetical protein
VSTPAGTARMVEVSGPQALWLLEGGSQGRLVCVQRDLAVVRPARHVWGYGRPAVRVPAPARAVPAVATYHVDEMRVVPGTGWTVTVRGPAEAITDLGEAAHHRRTPSGWSHGAHGTLLRLHPKTATGFRLARTEV